MIEVAGVLIHQNGEYVLQQRDDIPYIADPGLVSLWGGTLEPTDSSPVLAAVRELKEETGVEVLSEDLKLIKVVHTTGKSKKSFSKPVTAYLYAIEIDGSILVKCFEGAGVVRVRSISEIPENKRSEFLIFGIEGYESEKSQNK